MPGVSIVIPCYNPPEYLMEAIASARSQRGYTVEVVLVNDGTTSPEGRKTIENARGLVDRYIEQPNRGAAAARNTGFDAARYEWIIPLDADDRLEPDYTAACSAALEAHPEAAFAYADYRVFGTKHYVERLTGYNLYQLLDRNVLTYAALIRKRDWVAAGGYDGSMSRGYEDWEFWLRLGSLGRYGQHVPRVLFGYRKHGPSLLDTARANHAAITGYIRSKHPELYEYDSRARVKARWAPAVTVVASAAAAGQQSILDFQSIDVQRIEDREQIQAGSNGPESRAFLVASNGMPDGVQLAPDSAELAALAVWGGKDALELADGSVALSQRGLERHLAGKHPAQRAPRESKPAPPLPPRLETIHRHLANAGLLSLEAWTRHPARSLARLIPLRAKEHVNRLCGQRLFDLSFYLQFQPLAVDSGVVVTTPLVYMPVARGTRRRIGLVTPHLGPGGAERVLMEIGGALPPDAYELFLIATQSADDSWLPQWRERARHVYDLRKLVDTEKLAACIYSIAVNWGLDALLVQNSLPGYAVLPQIKQRLPRIRTIDLIHSADEDWNLVAATRKMDAALDFRVAISVAVREELIAQGVGEHKIRLISNGVDLERFSDLREIASDGPHRILFAGRLEAVKRPLLLVDIALELRQRRGAGDFRFVVAGDGPEAAGLRRRVQTSGLENLFEFRGHVVDVAPELAACEMVVLPSKAEGIPLIVLEAFAASRPVVASAVGGVPEVVSEETGILVPQGAGEAEKFAAALDYLIGDPGLRQRLGAHGRRLVELRFDRRRAAEEYRALFNGVLDESR